VAELNVEFNEDVVVFIRTKRCLLLEKMAAEYCGNWNVR